MCLVNTPLVLRRTPTVTNHASQAFLYGDNKKFNVTIVVPEMPELRAWAEKQGVSKEVRSLVAWRLMGNRVWGIGCGE